METENSEVNASGLVVFQMKLKAIPAVLFLTVVLQETRMILCLALDLVKDGLQFLVPDEADDRRF